MKNFYHANASWIFWNVATNMPVTLATVNTSESRRIKYIGRLWETRFMLCVAQLVVREWSMHSTLVVINSAKSVTMFYPPFFVLGKDLICWSERKILLWKNWKISDILASDTLKNSIANHHMQILWQSFMFRIEVNFEITTTVLVSVNIPSLTRTKL